MRFDEDILKELLQEDDPGKAIGEWIVDDTNNIDDDCLINLCDNGGWPEEPQYTFNGAERTDDTYKIHISVFLDEVYPGACSDLPHREPQKGSIEATVDLATGDVNFRSNHEY